MSKLQELVDQFKTEEGTVDWEKAEEQYQSTINGIVTKNTAKAVEKARSEYTEQFIQDLGIEAKDLDGVKLWAKKMAGNTDEIKEANVRLENELNEIREKYSLTAKEYEELKGELTAKSQIAQILSKGYDAEEAEFIHFKLSKQATEEKPFEELLEEYAKDNEQETKTTQRYQKRQFKSGDTVSDSFKRRYPKYFKS